MLVYRKFADGLFAGSEEDRDRTASPRHTLKQARN
jgi:hypothetical protein